MQRALVRHDTLIGECVARYGGTVVHQHGEGDSRFAVFAHPGDAVAAACDLQRAFRHEAWPTGTPLRIRAALHTGDAIERAGHYYGSAVNRCARLRGLAHGGQVVLSEVTAALVRGAMPAGADLRDLAEHRLRGFQRPERVYQFVHPDLPADFATLAGAHRPLHNLPAPPTPLLGRDEEVRRIRDLWGHGATRLVTLTGPGGVGKTRLALRVATDFLDRFADGVFLVPLASISDPALVTSAVAQALGLQESGGRRVEDTVRGYLQEKDLLLVLDNFEQILPAAPLVADLLAACPRLKVLITSRSVLHLRGEREFAVSPLALPDAKCATSAGSLRQYAAVVLFVQRAVDAKADFSLTDGNASAVAEICRRLDGLPLAIELAAARIKMLSPEALLARLERRLPLLIGGARDLPERQRTLRDTLAWSYDLLSVAERTLFRRLAIFVGGCTLEAAELVCDADKDLSISVLDGLTALLAQSLIQRHDAEEGEPCFSMLETIREYAEEQLEASGEASTVRRHHFHHFLSFAEAAQAGMRGPHQAAWLKRLEADHANFRAALQWASSHDVDLGLRLGVALWWFWWVRGHAGEGRHWLESMLPGSSVVDADVDENGSRHSRRSPVLARARQGAGLLTRSLGDYDRATALLEQSFADFCSLRDDGGAAVCLGHLAWMAGDQGDRMRAMTLLEQGLVLAHADAVNECDAAFALQWLGAAARDIGDNERARALFAESLDLSRRLQDQWSIAQNLQWLGSVAWRQGHHGRAMELLTESLTRQQALGDRPGMAWTLHLLGRVVFDQGYRDRASRLHLESLELHRDTGEPTGISAALRGLGRVDHARGDLRSAARLFGAARALEVPGPSISLLAAVGEFDDVSALRSNLDDEAIEAAWGDGQAEPGRVIADVLRLERRQRHGLDDVRHL